MATAALGDARRELGQGGRHGSFSRARGAWRRWGTGPAARPRVERERGVGRGLPGNELAVVKDDGGAVEELADLDTTPRKGAAPRARGDIDDARAKADGVVAGDDAFVAAPDQPCEIWRQATPHGRRQRRPGKAAIEVGAEGRQ